MAVKSEGVCSLLIIIRENSRCVVKNGLDFCRPTLIYIGKVGVYSCSSVVKVLV